MQTIPVVGKMSIFSVSSVGWKKKKKNTIEDIRCNLSQESKIAACTWFEEFFHHSWLLWNSENHELHKCYFIKFDLSMKTWQPAVSQVWEILTSCCKRWLLCFNYLILPTYPNLTYDWSWHIIIPDTMVSWVWKKCKCLQTGTSFYIVRTKIINTLSESIVTVSN